MLLKNTCIDDFLCCRTYYGLLLKSITQLYYLTPTREVLNKFAAISFFNCSIYDFERRQGHYKFRRAYIEKQKRFCNRVPFTNCILYNFVPILR